MCLRSSIFNRDGHIIHLFTKKSFQGQSTYVLISYIRLKILIIIYLPYNVTLILGIKIRAKYSLLMSSLWKLMKDETVEHYILKI